MQIILMFQNSRPFDLYYNTSSYENIMCIFEFSYNKTNTCINVNTTFTLVTNTVLCWIPKHKLDIPVIRNIVKIYKSTTSASYGPVLHC